MSDFFKSFMKSCRLTCSSDSSDDIRFANYDMVSKTLVNGRWCFKYERTKKWVGVRLRKMEADMIKEYLTSMSYEKIKPFVIRHLFEIKEYKILDNLISVQNPFHQIGIRLRKVEADMMEEYLRAMCYKKVKASVSHHLFEIKEYHIDYICHNKMRPFNIDCLYDRIDEEIVQPYRQKCRENMYRDYTRYIKRIWWKRR